MKNPVWKSILVLFALVFASPVFAQVIGEQLVGAPSSEAKAYDINNFLDFTDLLRRVPGVYVFGQGPSAEVRTRISRPGAPAAFVVDGEWIGNDFRQLVNSVDITAINRVEALRSFHQMARYPYVRGGGIIAFTTSAAAGGARIAK